jgi:Ca2+-binding RTX toxin-like protein
MSARANARINRSLLVSYVHGLPSFMENLERRVLLSVTPVPITTPLNTGSGAVKSVLQDLSKLSDLTNEVVKIDSKLTDAIGKLPLVGDGIKNAIAGPNDKFKSVADAVKGALQTLQSAGTITGTDIQSALFTALGPSGAGILPSSITSAAQVPVSLSDTDGTTSDAEQVELDLDFQGNLFTAALNPGFDLGLPALGLSLDGTIQAQLSYDAKLDIGLDATNGFYINLGKNNPEMSLTLAVTAPGLHASGHLGFLQLDATDGTDKGNTKLVGTIAADFGCTGGLLTPSTLLSITSNSTLSADADAELHLHNVLSFGGSAKFPSLQADLDLSWNLGNASLNSGGVGSASFGSEPDAGFNNVKLDMGSFFSQFVSPIVNEVRTILKPLQPVIDLLNTRLPIFSDIDFLKNDLGFDVNHDNQVTLIEMLDKLGGGSTKLLDTIVAIDDLVNHIPAVGGNVLLDLGKFDLGGSSNANGADLRGLSDLAGINLSNFSATSLGDALSSLGPVGSDIGDFVNKITSGAFGGAGGADGAGLHFSLLENPSSAFKLLLGQNVDLFTFDSPTMDLHAPLDEFFPLLGPLGVELRGTLNSDNDFAMFKAHVSMGFDTAGLVEFANSGFSPSHIGDLFDGLYVLDDPTRTYASAGLGIGAYASLNVVVFSAGVGGGISGTLDLSPNDPGESTPPLFDDGQGVDGKLRPKEIGFDLSMSPLCLFNISGKITASFDAYVRVGVDLPLAGFVGWSDDYTIASATLADFSAGCDSMPASPPFLATLLSDGTLRLNMGPHAADRVNGDIDDDDESFVVTHVSSEGDGTETVTVTALGYVQTYSGVRSIYGEGGNGNDSILLQQTVSPAALYGDFNGNDNASGNDTLGGADGPVTLHGGGGDDQLTTGTGSAMMYGEAGTDLLVGGSGDDLLDGGEGDDKLLANGGRDSLYGQGGDDYLDGGSENDLLDGGDNDDHEVGGTGDDTVIGGNGNDVLEGNAGLDSIEGGSGSDVIFGDDGDLSGSVVVNDHLVVVPLPGGEADIINGGDQNDIIFGQGGNDSINGGNGDDYVEGNAGDDLLGGDAGNDSLIGGQGNDSITGDAGNDLLMGDDGSLDSTGKAITADSATDGNDTLSCGDGNDSGYGQGGNDLISGDAGNDLLDGAKGNDSITGGTDNDTLTGGDGNDLLQGNDGDDSMLGGNDSDTMLGGAGNDFMDGQAGNDSMSGEDDNDVMNGGDGNDSMLGQGGNDLMSGMGGDDDMIGGSGADSMSGGDGQDVMLGDDGTIAPASPAQLQPETISTLRIATPASMTDGGNDTMDGGAGNDAMYGQGGDDQMVGGDNDDYMEGNAGADTLSGGAGDDDLIGGSAIVNTPDGADVMDGGSGNDVLLGDNGQIVRLVNLSDNTYQRYTLSNKLGLQDNAVIRTVTLFADADLIGGNDTMNGGAGDDIMYGQVGVDSMLGGTDQDQMIGGVGSDLMDGQGGNDCLLGDKGTINPSIFDGSTQENISSQGHKVSAVINVAGKINWSVALIDSTIGGNDTINGGQGDDVVHAGAGADRVGGDDGADPAASGAGGNDILFGDDGDDILAGQGGDDQIFAGAGDDLLDGGIGNDTSYGGDGQDTLVADNKSDYLIDWFGNFNTFIVPGHGFGAPTIIRSPAPQMQDFVLALATAGGSSDAVGETGLVTPPSPANAGHR